MCDFSNFPGFWNRCFALLKTLLSDYLWIFIDTLQEFNRGQIVPGRLTKILKFMFVWSYLHMLSIFSLCKNALIRYIELCLFCIKATLSIIYLCILLLYILEGSFHVQNFQFTFCLFSFHFLSLFHHNNFSFVYLHVLIHFL